MLAKGAPGHLWQTEPSIHWAHIEGTQCLVPQPVRHQIHWQAAALNQQPPVTVWQTGLALHRGIKHCHNEKMNSTITMEETSSDISQHLLTGFWVILCSTIWLNSFWPRDTIRRQRSGSTLAQVMAWCLTAPSHYLNQCWLIVSEIQWHSY